MSSVVDIQIVSMPNLEKIESYLKDSTYRESIEFSANFNTRLCIERRLRLPSQNHSNLFVNKRQRMPGFRQGQIYTYPAQRWRKSRRQYLNKMYRFPDRPFQSLRKEHDALLANSVAGTSSPSILGTSAASSSFGVIDPDLNGSLLMEESSSLGAFGGDTSDSKDSQQQQQQTQQQTQPTPLQPMSHAQHPLQQHQQQVKEELPKDWYYDDIDINDLDSLEEPKSPADDEYDYDPRYGSKKRRKRRPSKRALLTPGEGGGGGSSGRRKSGAGRGRNLATANVETALIGTDALDGSGLPAVEASTPTTSGGSTKRSRGSGGTRGRRRTKAAAAAACDPPSPGLNSEPLSFEMAAAAVGVISDLPGAPEEQADLRNYRKYL